MPHIASTLADHTLSEHILTRLDQAKLAEDRAFITALGRGLLLLSLFEDEHQLSHQQLCQKSKLPKATVSRLIYTLEGIGMLYRGDDERYRLGKSLLKLTASSWSRHNLVDDALPLLKDFAITHQVSVNIATEMDGEMRYVACYRSPARLAVNLTVGSSVPLAQTAIGRAYFVSQSSAEQQQLLKSVTAQSPLSAAELTQGLYQQVEFYQQQGYCLSDGDFSSDILAVGVPLFDHAKGAFTHALNASVPKANWQPQQYVAFIVPKLQQLKAQIEAK